MTFPVDRLRRQLFEARSGDRVRQRGPKLEAVDRVLVMGQHQRWHVYGRCVVEIRDRSIARQALQARHGVAGAPLCDLPAQGLSGIRGACGDGTVGVGHLEALQRPSHPIVHACALIQGTQQLGDVGVHRHVAVRHRAIEPGRAREYQPGDALGIPYRDVERDAGAHGDAADDGAGDTKVIQQRDEVVAKRVEGQVRGIGERERLSVRAGVKGQQAHTVGWAEQPSGLAHVPAEAVLEDERDTRPDVEVVEADRSYATDRHGLISMSVCCPVVRSMLAHVACRKASDASTSVSARPCMIKGAGTWRRSAR